uniref:Uncharacterized protein n=1 Tax=Timema tahoe TaxID=61484 RepID=A0A7R9IPX7_9NEOP|nr:unnamed protein product [Timema tahoe]
MRVQQCAKKKKKPQNLKEKNMAELTQKYFTCNMKIHKSLTGGKINMKISPSPAVSHVMVGKINMKISSSPVVSHAMVGKINMKISPSPALSNNQINLTTAGELIKKKAGDKVKECMDVLEVCANKVGVQPSECLAGEFACNCVIDVSIRQHREKSSGAIVSNSFDNKSHRLRSVQLEWGVDEARHMLDQSVKGSCHSNLCTLPDFLTVTEYACTVVTRQLPLCGSYAPQPTPHADPKEV